jgi:hypothetical protein
MASIEHVTEIPLSCLGPGIVFDRERKWSGLIAVQAWLWSHIDEDRCRGVMDHFQHNGTAWIPTLVVSETMLSAGGHDGRTEPLDDASRAALDHGLTLAARLAVYLHRAGGLVGVGTDFPIDGVTPGESVHHELELLVRRGGATHLEAVRIATIESARVLGYEATLGSIEPGKVADLVVLDRNPLEDIVNTRSIAAVIHHGVLRTK